MNMKKMIKWQFIKKTEIIAIAVIIGVSMAAMSMTGCDVGGDEKKFNSNDDEGDTTKLPVSVTLNRVTANGFLSQRTTQLTLSFSSAITGLSASDITLSGVSSVSKGTLSGSNPYYLPISGFSSGGSLNVAVAKSRYNISGSPKTVIIYTGNDGIEMVQIPGGSFQMGDVKNEGYSDEKPIHTVTLSDFYMGKYEVTQAQYRAVMGSNPSDENPYGGVGDNYPVYYVSWYGAIVFCNKLSMAEGLNPAYRINGSTDPSHWGEIPTSSNSRWNSVEIVTGSTGYRLPTEAQWEYAAKGGNGSPGNYTYSGSNSINNVAWYHDNSGFLYGTHEVGEKSPNGLGLYDMSGNVLEWCWDWYGDYSSSAQTDPQGASSGSYRVARGGSWFDSAEYVRSVYRVNFDPSPGVHGDGSIYYMWRFTGFRLVRP